jgi:hypothetical protein
MGAYPRQRGDRISRLALRRFRMRKGEIWRVQIVWPNGMVRHVGQFASEKEAAKWILAHPRLTMPAEENPIMRLRVCRRHLRRVDF